MIEPFAPSMGPPVAGALALIPGWMDTTNRGNFLSLPNARVQAGPFGLQIGNFCFIDPDTGIALNSNPGTPVFLAIAALLSMRYPVLYQSPGTPVVGPGGTVYQGAQVLMIGPGSTVYPFKKGYIWAPFPGGAIQGDPVYADNTTGYPITGSAQPTNATETSFSVYTPCKPGGVAIITAN